MPSRACLRCGALFQGGGSYCVAHRRAKPRNPARRSGWEAQRWSQKIKAQTGGRCAQCGSTRNVEAHHLHPLAEGGRADGPGVPLCRACHSRARA